MRREYWIAIAVVLIVVIVAGGVLYYVSLPPPEVTPIKIGALYPITGAVPIAGRDQLAGQTLAEEDINDGVGAWELLGHEKGVLGRPVKIVVEDSECNPEVAVTKLRRLDLEEGIDMTVGLISTGCALAIMPKIAEYHHIFLAYNHGESSMNNYPLSDGWLFSLHVDSRSYARGLLKIMKEMIPEAESLAFIAPNYSWGWDMYAGVEEAIEILGWDVELKDPVYPALGTREYAPFISSILAMDVDGVICGLYGDDIVCFIRQAIPYNFFEGLEFACTLSGGEITALGEETPEGLATMECGLNCLYPDTSEMEDLRERFHDRFGIWPGGASLETYGGMMILCHAIETAGTTDVETVRETLEGIDVSLPWSDYNIREFDHQGLFDSVYGLTGYSDVLEAWASIPEGVVPMSEVVLTQEELEAIWAAEGFEPPYP